MQHFFGTLLALVSLTILVTGCQAPPATPTPSPTVTVSKPTASLPALTPTPTPRVVEIDNQGTICFSTYDSARRRLPGEVRAPGCWSSSCTDILSATLSATLVGTEIRYKILTPIRRFILWMFHSKFSYGMPLAAQ